MKTRCPHCKSEFECDDSALGAEADCPTCQLTFVVTRAKASLKPSLEAPQQTILVEQTSKKFKKPLLLASLSSILCSVLFFIFLVCAGNCASDNPFSTFPGVLAILAIFGFVGSLVYFVYLEFKVWWAHG